MRALTHGLKDVHVYQPSQSRNEVLAREGIDTTTLNSNPHLVLCRNEVLAREGIDTIGNGICNHRRNQCVEMRY